MKRIISLILVLVTLLSCFCVPIFAYENYVGLDKPLHKTTVEEDLENAGFDFDTWLNNGNFDDYVEVLFTREYGYTKDGAALLYFYVYIDPGIYEVFPGAVHDTFEFEIANKLDENGNPISYITRSADLVDYSEDKRFYKYCARELGGFEWEDGRLYYIGDVEVYQNGDELCKYETSMRGTVNRAFYYKGTDDLNTLNCEVFQDGVIDLRTTATIYRTISSDKVNKYGKGFQYDIFSVYFSVPNEYFEKYDYLKAITYATKEQTWNAVVVDDDEIYNHVYDMLGVDFSSGPNKYYASIYSDYRQDVYVPSGVVGSLLFYERYCDISVNNITRLYSHVTECYDEKEMLLNAYKVDDWQDDDIFISANNVTDFFDYTETGEAASYRVETKNFYDTFDVKSYSGNDPSWIKSWIAKNFYKYNEGYETEISNVLPIVCFSDRSELEGYIPGENDREYAQKLLVNKNDLNKFSDDLDTALLNNETLVLFRFAVRDYYSADCVVAEPDLFEVFDENGFYCQGTAFNNFNVISLTFRKSNQDFIVNVNDDPQDINGGVTGPQDTVFDDIQEGVSGVINEFKDFYDPTKNEVFRTILLVFCIIILIIIITLLSKPIAVFVKSLRLAKTKRSDKVNNEKRSKKE